MCAFLFHRSIVFHLSVPEMRVTIIDAGVDKTGRVVHFDRVALDQVPLPDEVAVGSMVIFPQGVYVGTQGNNTGGSRYHQVPRHRTICMKSWAWVAHTLLKTSSVS